MLDIEIILEINYEVHGMNSPKIFCFEHSNRKASIIPSSAILLIAKGIVPGSFSGLTWVQG